VAGKPAATEITSSPGFNLLFPSLSDVRAANDRRFADEPEFVSITCETPRNSAIFSAKDSEKRPSVSQKSRDASTALISSVSSKIRPA